MICGSGCHHSTVDEAERWSHDINGAAKSVVFPWATGDCTLNMIALRQQCELQRTVFATSGIDGRTAQEVEPGKFNESGGIGIRICAITWLMQ
jgi:hypothetical protein